MIDEEKPKKRSVKTKVFGPEEARTEVLAKLAAARAKGKLGFTTAKTAAAKCEVYDTILNALEAEQVVFVDRSKVKPKYFLREFQPPEQSSEAVAGKLLETVRKAHPTVFGQTELRKVLTTKEKPLFARALAFLIERGDLHALTYGKKELYLHYPSLGEQLAKPASCDETEPAALDPGALRDAYRRLVAQTRFPAIEIAALQREAGLAGGILRGWLLEEYQAGRVVLSAGDWSLSDEQTREGAIHDRGERFLLVRFHE